MKKCTHINLFPNKLNMLTDIQINPFQNKILGNYIPKCCRILFKGGYRILKWMHLVVRLVRGSAAPSASQLSFADHHNQASLSSIDIIS